MGVVGTGLGIYPAIAACAGASLPVCQTLQIQYHEYICMFRLFTSASRKSHLSWCPAFWEGCCRLEAERNCQLHLMLFYQVFKDDDAKMLYPLNYLRNYARMQAKTKLVAMIDADLVISSTLSDEFARTDRYGTRCPHTCSKRGCLGTRMLCVPGLSFSVSEKKTSMPRTFPTCPGHVVCDSVPADMT